MPPGELPALVGALLHPSAYAHPTGRIRLIQTHISYVLLAGEYVYKIKKPVDFGFLDFSTLGKRRYYCRQEVVLNSRLCSDTYLGVVPIRLDGVRITVGGRRGRILEYAVHMRRLPEEQMMDRLLEAGKVTRDMVERVARRLTDFHERAATSRRIAEYGDWAIRYNHRENVAQWTPYIGRALSPEQDRILRAYGEAFFARKADILQRRVDELRIRRIHADLRSDAVCFQDGVCIFDCVEFSRRISLLDVACDVGFLAMDLEFRGRADLANAFVDDCVRLSRDSNLREICDFYACYSACVRGKVEAFRLDLPEFTAAQKASRRYFDLACQYAEELPPAILVITCGLAGTGKSTIARGLAERTGFKVLSSDEVRKRLAGIGAEERRVERFGGGIYAPDFTERTYAALFEQARPLLLKGRSVIVDATFLRREHRRAATRLAREAGAQFACLELQLNDEEARKRLDRRIRDRVGPSDASWETYRAQKQRFQRPAEVPDDRRIAVNAKHPLRTQLRRVLSVLRELSPLSFRNVLEVGRSE
jgi:aminoglycoside phosphotransferase family enzyme/predicted kinase